MKDKQLSRMQLTDLIKKSLRGSTTTELKAAVLKHVSCVTALIDMDGIRTGQNFYDLEAKMNVMGLRCITRRYKGNRPDIYQNDSGGTETN